MATKKPDFSDSEADRLRKIADEKGHMEWLREKRKARMDAIRGWVTWLTAAWVLKDLLWRDLGGWLKDHLK